MDSGETILILCRLIPGALATFLAIMLWPKTRDPAWMLMAMGTIGLYAQMVYSILELLGIVGNGILSIGSVSLMSVFLPCLPMAFFSAAFLLMILRNYPKP